MCIEDRQSKKEVKNYRDKQPKNFYVWKVMADWFTSEYAETIEPRLIIPDKIYKAGNYPAQRSSLNYKPGFHVFRNIKDVREYQFRNGPISSSMRVKFKAKREWIKQVGTALGINCLVLSNIQTLKGK